LNLRKCDADETINNVPYRQLVGKLLYLAVLTRPDISFSVSLVSKFLESHSESHWKYCKRILRYIKGTNNFGIYYRKTEKQNILIGYSDSSWGSDEEDRRSTIGFAFILNSGVVS